MHVKIDERWVYLNGRFCLERDATIPVTDRGFLYGEGIFTSIRVENGRCELLSFHADRLKNQAKLLNFDCEPLPDKIIAELICRNKAEHGVWRLKIIATVKEEGEKGRSRGSFLASLHPYVAPLQGAASLCLYPFPIDSPHASIKSLSYLDRLIARNFAAKFGAADALIKTREGFLLETGSSNLFWVDGGKLWMPHPELPYLKGVFLQAFLPHISLPVEYARLSFDQIPSSASVYICNALTHVRPVGSIADVEPMSFGRDLVFSSRKGENEDMPPNLSSSWRQFPLCLQSEGILKDAALKALEPMMH